MMRRHTSWTKTTSAVRLGERVDDQPDQRRRRGGGVGLVVRRVERRAAHRRVRANEVQRQRARAVREPRDRAVGVAHELDELVVDRRRA